MPERSSVFTGIWNNRADGKVEIYVKGTLVGSFDDATADLVLPTNGLVITAGGITVTAGGFTITDGGLTVTAGGITVTAGNLDMTDGTILNVGGSANDWTATAFSVSGANSGAVNLITVLNSSDDASAGAAVDITCGGSSASGDALVRFTETSSHIMTMGIDASSSIGVIAMNTLLGSADGDWVRIVDAAPPTVTFNAAHSTTTFDYVCSECGSHGGTMFQCCELGEVAWHDDVAAMDVALQSLDKLDGTRITGYEPAIQHLAKLGVMEVTPSDIPGEEGKNWVGMNSIAAQWFTWSGMRQMYQRINDLENKLALTEA